MGWYRDIKLVKGEEGYCVEIYLNPDTPEFAGEFLENIRENVLTLEDEIENVVREKFSGIKVNSVKLVLGALIVGSIPLMGHTKVQAEEPAYSTQQVATTTYGIVTADKLNVRQGPSTYDSIIHQLWNGNRVRVIDETSGWYKILLSDGRTGWVSKAYLKVEADSREQRINTVINTAKSLLGTPYVWGGKSPQDGGFDCSGFTQYVYAKAGVSLNRISRDQATQGFLVSRANLQPGDLVFFSLAGDGQISHVGIYIGGGMMIHSPKTGDVVKTTDIRTSFWDSHYVTARRVL